MLYCVLADSIYCSIGGFFLQLKLFDPPSIAGGLFGGYQYKKQCDLFHTAFYPYSSSSFWLGIKIMTYHQGFPLV